MLIQTPLPLPFPTQPLTHPLVYSEGKFPSPWDRKGELSPATDSPSPWMMAGRALMAGVVDPRQHHGELPILSWGGGSQELQSWLSQWGRAFTRSSFNCLFTWLSLWLRNFFRGSCSLLISRVQHCVWHVNKRMMSECKSELMNEWN